MRTLIVQVVMSDYPKTSDEVPVAPKADGDEKTIIGVTKSRARKKGYKKAYVDVSPSA